MPAYAYRAVDPSGRITQGQHTAISEQALQTHLSASGYELLESRERHEHLSFKKRFLSAQQLALFSTHLTDMLRAGIPFIDALRHVAEASERKAGKEIYLTLIRHIHHGTRIAAAFQETGAFPPVFTAILEAGETGGDLPSTFERLTPLSPSVSSESANTAAPWSHA